MSKDVIRQQNSAYRTMKALEGSPRVKKVNDYVTQADIDASSDYVQASLGLVKQVNNYDLDSIERTGDLEYIDYEVYKYASVDGEGNAELTSKETIKAPPIAPLVTAKTPTFSRRPIWSWDSVGVEYEVSYDNTLFFSVGQETSFQAYLDLLPGDWTLYVRSKNINSEWSEVGQFTITIQQLGGIIPLDPTIYVESPTTNTQPVFSITSEAKYFRYNYDENGYGATTTTKVFIAPVSIVGNHTLRVQASNDGIIWSSGNNLTTVEIEALPIPNDPVISVTSPTSNLKPTFNWTDTGLFYETSLDSGPWNDNGSGASFAPISDLSIGSHTLKVRASNDGINWSVGNNEVTVVIEEGLLTQSVVRYTFEGDSTNSGTNGASSNGAEFGTLNYLSDDNGGYVKFENGATPSNIPTGTTFVVQPDLTTVICTSADGNLIAELPVGTTLRCEGVVVKVATVPDDNTFTVDPAHPFDQEYNKNKFFFKRLLDPANTITFSESNITTEFTFSFIVSSGVIISSCPLIGKQNADTSSDIFGVDYYSVGIRITGQSGSVQTIVPSIPLTQDNIHNIVVSYNISTNNLKVWSDRNKEFDGTPTVNLAGFTNNNNFDWILNNRLWNADTGNSKMYEINAWDFVFTDQQAEDYYNIFDPQYAKLSKIADVTTSPFAVNSDFYSYWSDDIKSVNEFKETDAFRLSNENDIDIDSDGYPTDIRNGASAICYFRQGVGTNHLGQRTIKFDGEGTISIGGDATNVNINYVTGVGTFDINSASGSGVTFTITDTDPNSNGNYLRNIRVYETQYETNYDLGEILHPVFKAKLQSMDLALIRTMESQEINGSRLRRPSQLVPLSRSSWNAPNKYGIPYEVPAKWANEIGRDLWTCVPLPIDDDLTGDIASISGTTVTLNGGAATTELTSGDRLRLVTSNNSYYNYYITVDTITNDDVFEITESFTGDYEAGDVVRLANDTFDELCEAIAIKLYNTLDSNLKLYIEFTNEQWNSTGGFAQFFALREEADTVGVYEGDANGAARLYSDYAQRMFRIFNDIFSSRAIGTGTEEQYQNGNSRVIRVVGGQAVSTGAMSIILTNNGTHKYVDAVAIAPYFNPAYFEDPTNFNTIPTMLDSEISPYFRTHMDSRAGTDVADYKTLVDGFTDIRLISYEGGPHLPEYQYSYNEVGNANTTVSIGGTEIVMYSGGNPHTSTYDLTTWTLFVKKDGENNYQDLGHITWNNGTSTITLDTPSPIEITSADELLIKKPEVYTRMMDYNKTQSMADDYEYALNLWSTNTGNEIFTHYKITNEEFGLYTGLETTDTTPKITAAQNFITNNPRT